MASLPTDLLATAKLVEYRPLPLNADGLHKTSKLWLQMAEACLKKADDPTKKPGTVWDVNTSWQRGNDPALDAFVAFFDNYPRTQYHDAAKLSPKIAAALNNLAGIAASHHTAANKALKAARDELSKSGHMLGGSYHTVLFFHVHGESGSAADADSAVITKTMAYLKKLNEQTKALINLQTSVIDALIGSLQQISDNARKATATLPGGAKYVKESKYDYDWWRGEG